MSDICFCGHVLDEHDTLESALAPCAVAGCPCAAYEEEPEEDE